MSSHEAWNPLKSASKICDPFLFSIFLALWRIVEVVTEIERLLWSTTQVCRSACSSRHFTFLHRQALLVLGIFFSLFSCCFQSRISFSVRPNFLRAAILPFTLANVTTSILKPAEYEKKIFSHFKKIGLKIYQTRICIAFLKKRCQSVIFCNKLL